MPARLMPLTITLVVLGVISGILLATVGASGPSAAPPAVSDGEGGGDAAAACLEGAEDCNDMPGIAPICAEGADDCDDMIEPGDGSMNMCIEGAEDCNDMIVEEPPTGGGDGPTNLVGVEFTADYTQADIDLVTDIIVQFDHNAEVLVLERFPPAASAVVHHDSPNYCEGLIEQLEAVHGVDSASCAPYDPAPVDPDEPVSNEPGGSGGSEGSAGPDCAPPSVRTPAGCAAPGYIE